MFLKSLILRGFKTFADPVEVEFTENARITAIVGPNGCGKSNLLDATRWVLGENNPRDLRVASLADIIFTGTTAKRALSLAEVTLVFDNSSGKLPLAFEEVAIKRRTFREGESEFFINKNQCRLKDIRDLLLDTGLGEGTYSIITQGQVDAILSSKGGERRAVFEEAAGINKYKFRKYSAEKKLIAAEQNILRINDLKIEVGEHIITLEEQARKAREYLEIQSQIKDLDIGLCNRMIENINEKKDRLMSELDRVKQQSQTKKQAEEKDFEELKVLKDEHRKLEIEIDDILIKLEEDKDKVRDIELDCRFTDGEVKREERILSELEEKSREIKEKVELARVKLKEGMKKLDLSSTPLSSSLETVLDQASNLVSKLSSIFSFFGKAKPFSLDLGDNAEKEEAYKMRLEMFEEEKKRNEKEKERVCFALQAHRTQLENLNSKIGDAKAVQTTPSMLVQKKQVKEGLSQKIAVLEEKIREDSQSERKSIDEENALAISLAKLEGELNGIREKLSLEYNLSLEEAATLPQKATNISKTKSEVESGKQKLRALEPVNLLAIEEFEKERERLNFIETQLTDLNSARDNLRSLIIELDIKAEQTFLETMEKLSGVFSETFAKLFVGGEAKITLSPGTSALESDIEISVKPSGRKWLPLHILSGGERALSAIAVLFSLLKIRPSPFCFLDEVDAALDDANIGRFADIVRDFSAQSQIIMITHNKRTMAVANNIYGITMEEPGVSKVISMKLAEAA
ncbi:MAG: AAA family ATPase [Candidatus Margulisiibacteriota bacterium]|nr:AAA family ATPase [Candidatus Margulisiibacteriota bacterium]